MWRRGIQTSQQIDRRLRSVMGRELCRGRGGDVWGIIERVSAVERGDAWEDA